MFHVFHAVEAIISDFPVSCVLGAAVAKRPLVAQTWGHPIQHLGIITIYGKYVKRFGTPITQYLERDNTSGFEPCLVEGLRKP